MNNCISAFYVVHPLKRRALLLHAGIVALLFACFLLCGIANADTAAASPAKVPNLNKVSLQLRWKHQFQFAGYYAAIAKGFYRDAGLEVTLLDPPKIGDAVSEVLAGKADFGTTGPDLLLSRAKGQPVVALAVIFQHSPMVLLARKESGISSIHDLVNKRVMIEQPSAELQAYLQAEKMTSAQFTQVPHPHTPDAFIRGEVDAISAYISDEPFLIRQAGVEYLTLYPRSAGVDFYGDLLFTTQQQIDNNSERVKAFTEASLRGWDYALKNPDEIIDLILNKYSKRHSREHLAYEALESKQLIFSELVEVGYMNPGRWRYIAETYANLGMIPDNFQLKGFLYDLKPSVNLKKIYNIAAFVLLLAVIVFLIAARFYQQGKLINYETIARLQAEERLNQVSSQHQILVENAPFPIIISSMVEGKILYLNQKAASLLKIKESAAIGRLTTDFFADPQQRESFQLKLSFQGFISNCELLLKDTEGSNISIIFSSTIIPFENDANIFSSFIDISEWKKNQMELKEANHLLQLINENMTDVVWLLDLQTNRFLYISPSIFKLRGYTPEEILAQPVENSLSPKSRDEVAKWIAESLQKLEAGQILNEKLISKVEQPHRNGSIVYTEVRTKFIKDASGKYSQLLGVSRDISARIQAEEEKAKLETRYQQLQKTDSLNRMTGAISHHFNNTLHAVMGNLDLSLEDIRQGINPAENIEGAMKAARQASEMSALMLTCLGHLQGTREPLDLSAVCQNTFTELQSKLPDNVSVDLFLSPAPIQIQANAAQLRQAITGLVNNAVEAINDQHGKIVIQVRTADKIEISQINRFPVDWQAKEELYGCFEISDNGHGINNNDFERIFDPFFTTKFLGRGLGLAVILGIIRTHNGVMTVASEFGKGSTFRFYLPLP